jgi:hypothetical protein
MTEKENELQRLIGNIDDMHYLYTYDIRELNEADFKQKLEKITDKNKQTLAAIKELIDAGVDLNFKTQNGRSVMGLAVVRNNVELVELLLSYGVSLQETGVAAPLYRAAEFGADKVVKYLIEEKGLNPRKGEYSVLGVARSSPYSHTVLPYLIEVMKQTKSERQPPPKKLEELTEENMLKWYPQIAVPATVSKKLQELVESQFLIMYSTKLQWFYETIESHDPALIFACIDLIKKAITTEPKDKVVKTVKSPYAHHGNLEVNGDLKIKSLLVTGNLTIKGKASNLQGCRLFVGGDLICDTMYTEGPVIIGGNLKAGEVEAYYNDYALEVKQTLQADKLIIDRHQVIAGNFDVKERIDK